MRPSEPVIPQLECRPRLRDMRRLRRPETQADLETYVRRESASAERAANLLVSAPDRFARCGGFDEGFLGDFRVALPCPSAPRLRDVLPVGVDVTGRLDYRNFTVVMSESRRQAMFAAVNVAGARASPLDADHRLWSLDGRLPLAAQIDEAFFAGSRLDRGQLVPAWAAGWGPAARSAVDDTFHFTNCAPHFDVLDQQPWRGVEGYILRNAHPWRDRCSVFCGPVLGDADLRYRGVLVARSFWKVVAFVAADGRPSATGYVVEQPREFGGLDAAFGVHRTVQRSLRRIEEMTGLSFGALCSYDGFSNEEEIEGGLALASEIRVLGDIRV